MDKLPELCATRPAAVGWLQEMRGIQARPSDTETNQALLVAAESLRRKGMARPRHTPRQRKLCNRLRSIRVRNGRMRDRRGILCDRRGTDWPRATTGRDAMTPNKHLE